MDIGEEIQLGDQRTFNLLKQIWVIWIGLNAFFALIGIFPILLGIYAIFLGLPRIQIGMGIYVDSIVVMAAGVGCWVLFLGNMYIRSGLNKLDYFRWKLLVIESGLIGTVMGFLSLKLILNSDFSLQTSISLYRSLQTVLAALVGTGFWLVILCLAFNVRDKFRKT